MQAGSGKVPCESGCLRCGTCCIIMRVNSFLNRFYKPSYAKCPHLIYEDNRTCCAIFDSPLRPTQCNNFISYQKTKQVVMETRLRSFAFPEVTIHFLWLYHQGFIEHFPIVKDIRHKQYICMKRFYYFFVYPYIRNLQGTIAAREDWFDLWGLRDYFDNMPLDYEVKLSERARKTCLKIYNNDMPQNVECLLSAVYKYPKGRWIKMLKQMMWRENGERNN